MMKYPFLIAIGHFLLPAAQAFSPGQGGGGGDVTPFFLMLGLFFLIFYFVVLRPQQQEQKKHRRRVDSLVKGDRVVTAGGLHGEVRAPKEKTLVIEIADGVKVTVNRSSITTVVGTPEGGGRQKDEGEGE